RAAALVVVFFFVGVLVRGLARGYAFVRQLGDAVGDVGDHVETRDALLGQQVGRVRLGLAEDRDQHVAAVDLVLARGLHVRGGPLQDALEGERLLGQRLG